MYPPSRFELDFHQRVIHPSFNSDCRITFAMPDVCSEHGGDIRARDRGPELEWGEQARNFFEYGLKYVLDVVAFAST